MTLEQAMPTAKLATAKPTLAHDALHLLIALVAGSRAVALGVLARGLAGHAAAQGQRQMQR
jgi:hypothetical protein